MSDKSPSKDIKKEKKIKFNIANYKEQNSFFFDSTKYIGLLYAIYDMNELKYSEEDFEIINQEIEKCILKKNEINSPKQTEILPEFLNSIKCLIPLDSTETNYAKNIRNIVKDINERRLLSLRKIKALYKQKYQSDISITTISRVLKNHLNLHYLKTTIKNKKLNTDKYKFMSFVFLRGILRAIYLNLNIIFIDESGFYLQNNNFRMWRNRKEEILLGPESNSKNKINLLLAADRTQIINKKLIEQNVDEEVFYTFLKEIIEKIYINNKSKYILIIDNAAYHKTNKIFNFVVSKKIKLLTIVPYNSKFNMAEFVFRYLKNKIYKRIYNTISELKQDIETFLQSKELKDCLGNLYKETLEHYYQFEKDNQNLDLNEIYDNID